MNVLFLMNVRDNDLEVYITLNLKICRTHVMTQMERDFDANYINWEQKD